MVDATADCVIIISRNTFCAVLAVTCVQETRHAPTEEEMN